MNYSWSFNNGLNGFWLQFGVAFLTEVLTFDTLRVDRKIQLSSVTKGIKHET